jgi:hypothetical protein
MTWIALSAGTVCALVVPLTEPGLGWLLGGLAVLVAVLLAGPRRPASPTRMLAGVSALLLLAAGTVRAAGWLFVLCLVVAVPLASLAVAGGGRTWGRTGRGAAAVLVAAPRAAGSVRLRRISPGVLAGAGLTPVFAALFASADPVFGHLLGQAVPRVTPGGLAAGLVLFLAGVAVTLGAARVRAVPPLDADTVVPRALRRLDWVVPLALLDALFALFVAVQVTVLFGGHGYVLGPGGPSYAEYARNGFWQLGVVTLLTLAVVGFVAYRAARETRADRRLIRLLVGALSLLTLLIVASALRRMSLYVEAYGFTRVRLVAFTGELVLGVLFLLVLTAGVRLRAPWLPGATVAAVVVAVLTLVAIDPDAYIADTVIARYRHDWHLDAGYLSVLSADAVPAIDRLPEPYRSCVLAGMADRPSTVDRWYAVNAGRAAARRILAARPVPAGTEPCPWVFR